MVSMSNNIVSGIVLHIFALIPGMGLHDLAGFESAKVFKGSHKTGSMRASFYICIPGIHYIFRKAFLGKHFA